MPAPAAATDEVFPVWTDLVDNWRKVDAEWIRNRLVHVFDDPAERTSVITAPTPGMVTYLKTAKSLEFYHDTVWESVRYPNLAVSSDATTVTMRQLSAGSGIVLRSDGAAMASVLVVGQPTGAGGEQLDASGITVKVGTKSAKIATDATSLTVDSPVKVTGDVTASGALIGGTATIGALTVTGASTFAGAATVPALTVSGLVSAGTLNVGTNAEVAIDTGLAVFRHKNSAANRLSYDSSGSAILTGASVQINGPLTINNPLTVKVAGEFQTIPTLHPTGTTPAPVAGVIVSAVAPTVSDVYPNGTVWFQV